MGAVTVDWEFCSYLARDVALYADNDAVERIPPTRWHDDWDREQDDACSVNWVPVSHLLPSIFEKLQRVFRFIGQVERQIDTNAHSIIEDCLRSFEWSTECTAKAAIAEKIGPYLDDGLKRCESPIERLMLFGLLVTFGTHNIRVNHSFLSVDGVLSLGSYPHLGEVVLAQQAQLGQYRVDFLLGVSDCNRAIVIECDGHDFHERTKAQAQRDKSRDRWLQTHGYMVLHFTGSEIHWNTAGCAIEIFDAVKSLRDQAA